MRQVAFNRVPLRLVASSAPATVMAPPVVCSEERAMSGLREDVSQSSWRQLREVLGSVLKDIEPLPGGVENAAAARASRPASRVR